ncbi:MAG TPA: tRNA (adenosine(37)-N6)-threonylcarbamoyltransferase complex ATPase subunit type 1 TsaE [Kofleriaceae bacterium]|nr:tRNA (adenosine(37)-N6)-threonylcarbamoyltransferase complex ATPase subunit type 1 TsaE [Kofleriaceae bacterium]
MAVVHLADARATDRAGRALAALLAPGDVIGLEGDLGAGKTALVQGVAAGLGATAATSPTFTIVNEYSDGRIPIHHADLYRIEKARDLDEIGLDETIRRADGVTLVEWIDRFPEVLPRDHMIVTLRVSEDGGRTLSATGTGKRGVALAEAWMVALAR